MTVASGAKGGIFPPAKKSTIEEYKKPKDVLERLGSFRYGVVTLSLTLTFAKSSPGSGKNLKWLPEMAFQGF